MAEIDARAARQIGDRDGKLARVDKLGIGEALGAYLLQLASSTIQVTSSSKL